MKKRKIGLTIVLLLLITGTSHAGINLTVTSGTETIEDGDVYDRISTYSYAIVDMVGGEIDYITTYDDSIVNISGGHVGLIYIYGRSTVNLYNGSIDSITAGANISEDASIIFDCDLTSLNKTYDNELLIGVGGKWSNGDPFDIQIVNNNQLYPTGDFIEFIPEPISISLLGLGGLMVRACYHS